MAASKKWASIISVVASTLFAFLIVFQIPLFRVGCRNKSCCETPLEIISSELIASEVIPSSVVKTILYPGAIAKSLIVGSALPTYDHFYCFDDMNTASLSSHVHHLEVFLGSCLSLLGALLNLFKPTRIGFLGTLLIFWGLLTTDILLLDYSISSHTHSLRLYPMLFLASLSAFLSMRSDVRKIIKCLRSISLSKSTKGD